MEEAAQRAEEALASVNALLSIFGSDEPDAAPILELTAVRAPNAEDLRKRPRTPSPKPILRPTAKSHVASIIRARKTAASAPDVAAEVEVADPREMAHYQEQADDGEDESAAEGEDEAAAEGAAASSAAASSRPPQGQIRARVGHPDGMRYGRRGGGANAKWHTERARAERAGRLREFLSCNPKPQRPSQ